MGSISYAKLEPRPVDEPRRLRVVVIGAGISGILASIRLSQRVRNLSLQVYEKNSDIGGTWFENRYPGCACDIPAHTYQATFEPNHEWSQFYATSKEIHNYWKHVSDKYGCANHIKLSHEVIYSAWDDGAAKWRLKIKDSTSDTEFDDECDVLVSATGALNNWQWPDVPGLHNFKGKLLHSANWDESYDWEGKRLAVIGNGSSGIQILPAVLTKSVHIDHYVRDVTWIAPTFAREKVDEMGRGLDNFTFDAEIIQKFKSDPEYYAKFRKDIELELQSVHATTIKGTPEQMQSAGFFTENMRRRLAGNPALLERLVPTFPPACRRLTPGPGYLEALTDPKVDIIQSGIKEVVEDGIITNCGQHLPTDAIVCATGFNTTFRPRFPVVGRHQSTLADHWKHVPSTYLSLATDEFPNYFISLGPNSALGTGNLLLLIENVIDFIVACVAKIQRDNIRSMAPRSTAVQNFTDYCELYFRETVFTSRCKSWYKGGTSDGRVSALWPGSSLHALKVLATPRWEDFDYDYIDGNEFGWIGNGWTCDELNKTVKVDYLDPDKIDVPPTRPLPTKALS